MSRNCGDEQQKMIYLALWRMISIKTKSIAHKLKNREERFKSSDQNKTMCSPKYQILTRAMSGMSKFSKIDLNHHIVKRMLTVRTTFLLRFEADSRGPAKLDRSYAQEKNIF